MIFTPYVLIEAKRLVSIFDRLCSLFMSKEKIQLIHDYAVRSHQIFGQFIYGKFLDSLIIGIIAFIGLAILKVKFFPILAVFILITNMIPYFGPYIGGVMGGIIIVIVNPIQVIFFAILILVIQQFDGLFLGPKILGESTGLKPLWVIFAIVVGGALFGVLGMFLGVPVMAVICYITNLVVEHFLKKRNISVQPYDSPDEM